MATPIGVPLVGVLKSARPNALLDNYTRSKSLIERHLALNRNLIGGHLALEEVGQFLHILQLHERERVAGAETRRQPEHQEPLICDVLEILAHLDTGQSDYPTAQD